FTTGNSTGFENGDKCAYNWGSALGGSGTPADPFYNQVINGHHYYYQQEWSNQGRTCLQRFTFSGTQPVATLSVSPGSGNTIHFDASGSSAPGGVARYHWQFEDTVHGFSEAETASPTINHTYPARGTHTASLTVYAADGTSMGTAQEVGWPTARFGTSNTSPNLGEAVSFDASASNGPNGAITSYSWQFGDGATASGPKPTHVYTTAGDYIVTLTVTDGKGFTGASSLPVSADEAPAAAFSVTSAGPVAGHPTIFDASKSSDPDGGIVSYGWSFG